MSRGDTVLRKSCLFGYKLYLVCRTDSAMVESLIAKVTTSSVSDKPIYSDGIISILEILKKIHYMVANFGFSGKKMYELSLKNGFQLFCSDKTIKIDQ